MEIHQNRGKSMKIKLSLKSFEAELATKPCCLGERSNYVNQHKELQDVSSLAQFVGDMAEDNNIPKGENS